MRVIKLKKPKGRTPLTVRLGIANTPEQTVEYLQHLMLAKAKLAKAGRTKPTAKARKAKPAAKMTKSKAAA